MSDLRRLGALVFVLVVAAVTLSAQPALPALTAPVNDFAKALDADSVRELERRIRALQQATGDVVAVATVPSLDGFGTIDELALRLFENGGRGIGQKGKDNGALIVLALKERQARVEVGYDLEEFITDGYAGETIRATMVPLFREGQYGQGLLEGATRIINRIARRRGVELQDVPRPTQPISAPRAFNGFPVVLIVWIVIMMLSNRRRRRGGRWGRGPWSGWNSGVGPFGGGGFGGGFGGFSSGGGFGGGGGGFGGFGGGRSGGGGASGSW